MRFVTMTVTLEWVVSLICISGGNSIEEVILYTNNLAPSFLKY